MQDRARPSRVTLTEVAEQAGVSRATVSLVLRDSHLVAGDTRARTGRSRSRGLPLQPRRGDLAGRAHQDRRPAGDGDRDPSSPR
ncbi:LacI family DNA-binding transcriptional regulator [Pseudoroseomonas wenyumeiae]